jgi:phosphoglucomutase
MIKQGKINIIGEEVDNEFLKNVMDQSARPGIIDENFKVLYTPLHGSGYKLIPEVLKRTGLKNLLTVGEQMIPDGNFPTVKFPNPEFKEVFELGIEIAKNENCDLLIGTDPDADRTGIVVRTGEGEFVTLSGNQVGVLLLDYIITAKKENGTLEDDACAIKTIVTTELAAKVCEDNDVKIINVLTGFKFIGEKIKQFEETGENTFIFGYEESYGYLAGTYARDKDAVVASMLLVEMAAYYKTKNMTLYDAMLAIYKKYGYYGEAVQNIGFPGIDGPEKMKNLMDSLRNNPPDNLGGYTIAAFRDYKTSEVKNLKTGEVSNTGLPKSDVLYFDLENGSKVIIRPSGTEPKIKIYYLISAADEKASDAQVDKLKSVMEKFIAF